MTKPVTIHDIAKRANVSVATVSRALADSPRVTPETRNRIKQIARELNYVPNAIARGLVTKSSKTIGMVIPDIMNPFFPEVAKGLEACANRHGFNVLLCNSDLDLQKEREHIEDLFSLRTVGIAIMPVTERVDHILYRYPPNSNIVFISYVPDQCECSGVATNDFRSGFLGADYLVRLGHERVAFVGGGENRQITRNRYHGYAAALEKAALEPFLEPNGRNEKDPWGEAFWPGDSLLQLPEPPTAVVAYNDVTAISFMGSAVSMGYRVPEDISVVGIDDVYLSNFPQIDLTTVAQDKYAIGEICAQIIIERVNDPESGKRAVRKTLEPKLVPRGSCQRLEPARSGKK